MLLALIEQSENYEQFYANKFNEQAKQTMLERHKLSKLTQEGIENLKNIFIREIELIKI